MNITHPLRLALTTCDDIFDAGGVSTSITRIARGLSTNYNAQVDILMLHSNQHAEFNPRGRNGIIKLNACTLNLRNHIYMAALKPDAKPREAEAHSAISRWKHIELVAKRPRHRTVTTKSEEGASVAPNLLQQDFHADQPNQKWTSDTTYIWTQEGWVYLAVVLDLCSHMVVGCSMAAIVVCSIGRQCT